MSNIINQKELVGIGAHRIQSKSKYKMMCFCCGQTIHRGDYITQCAETGGMILRSVVKKGEGFYTPETGARWVHIRCSPPNGAWSYHEAHLYSQTLA